MRLPTVVIVCLPERRRARAAIEVTLPHLCGSHHLISASSRAWGSSSSNGLESARLAAARALAKCQLRSSWHSRSPALRTECDKSPRLQLSFGRLAERFKAAVLKTAEGSRPPWVRIPRLPPSDPGLSRACQPDGIEFSVAVQRLPTRGRSPGPRFERIAPLNFGMSAKLTAADFGKLPLGSSRAPKETAAVFFQRYGHPQARRRHA